MYVRVSRGSETDGYLNVVRVPEGSDREETVHYVTVSNGKQTRMYVRVQQTWQ